MQSAFVDLGLERDGFLYVSDVIATFEEFDRLETDDDLPSPPGENGTAASAVAGAGAAAAASQGFRRGGPSRLRQGSVDARQTGEGGTAAKIS
jgi:Ribonuclease G/E